MAARDVLIVEEDRKLREVLYQVFLSAGYNCLLAGDGHEGLEVFRRSHPALIVAARAGHALTAPHSRHLSSIDLLLQVRQEDPDVAVIVLAGASDLKTLIECLKLGAHAYLMKPISVDELLMAAERALERRQLIIEHRQHGQADWPPAPRDILIVEHNSQHRELFSPGLPVRRLQLPARRRRARGARGVPPVAPCADRQRPQPACHERHGAAQASPSGGPGHGRHHRQ